MSPDSTESQHHPYCVPTVNFTSCPNAKIYVNSIINSPHHRCSSQRSAISESPGGKNLELKKYFLSPDKDVCRVEIYYGKEEDKHNLPMVSVEIQKLSPAEIGEGPSKGTSSKREVKQSPEIKPLKAYVITVHTNNVSEDGAPIEPISAQTVLDHVVKADNVVLNSAGGINVGPGAGADNKGPFSGSNNLLQPENP